MSKQFKAFLIFVFWIVFGLDRITKSHVDWFLSLGPFTFEAHQNSGFILQTLTQTSVLARIVFVSSLFGFLFFFYLLVQALLVPALPRFRLGLTLLISAVAGNAYDRAVYGAVTDFICVPWFGAIVCFNFADVFMWIGVGMTLFYLVKYRDVIWHPDSKRRKYVVNPEFQFKFALQAALVAFCITLILVLFSYTYLVHVLQQNGTVYLISVIPLGLLFIFLTFIAGVVFSHRIAGPLFAIERYVDQLLKGENPDFRLRKSDDHQELTKLAEKIKKITKDR